MTTAAARTNGAGYAVMGPELGDTHCKTDQFKVETSGKGVTYFLEEKRFEEAEEDGRPVRLGDLLNSRINSVQLIAQWIYENGISLTTLVRVKRSTTKRPHYEVWTRLERFKAMSGRVYGHTRHDAPVCL